MMSEAIITEQTTKIFTLAPRKISWIENVQTNFRNHPFIKIPYYFDMVFCDILSSKPAVVVRNVWNKKDDERQQNRQWRSPHSHMWSFNINSFPINVPIFLFDLILWIQDQILLLDCVQACVSSDFFLFTICLTYVIQ